MSIKNNICLIVCAALAAMSAKASSSDDVLRALLVDDYQSFLMGSHHAMDWNKALYDPKKSYSVNEVLDVYIANEVKAKQLFERHFNLTGDVLRVGQNDRGEAYAVFLTTMKDVLFYAYVQEPQLLVDYGIGYKFNMVCADFQRLGRDIAVNCFEKKRFVAESVRLTFDRPDMSYFIKYAPSTKKWQELNDLSIKISQSPIGSDFLECMSNDGSDCYDLLKKVL